MATRTIEIPIDISVDDVQEALDSTAYLHAPFASNPEMNPLDVHLFWYEGVGTVLSRFNLRDEYLEIFNDDPERRAPEMLKVITSLRSLADEIEKIHSATISTTTGTAIDDK